MSNYTSTGGTGVAIELDYAALLAVRLISERHDRSLPVGAVPITLSLQRRDGPPGFDDVVVGWRRADEDGITFLQSKRTFSVGDNFKFRQLARAVAEFEDQRNWSATFVTGSLSPAGSDVQELLASARATATVDDFDRAWSQEGVLNTAKRQVLRGFRAATEGLAADAAWKAMRRLQVVEHDLDLPHSRDRQATVDLLTHQVVDPSTAEADLAAIRTALLNAANLAPTYDLPALVAAVPSLRLRSTARLREPIERLAAESRNAIAAIDDSLRGGGLSVSLLRPEDWKAARGPRRGAVRLVGEAGSGKSSLLKRLAVTFVGSAMVVGERRVSARTWAEHVASLGAPIGADVAVSTLASSGPCLLAIDGADRMLLDHRRGVVMDLFRAVASSPLRERCSIATTARDFGDRDLVVDALREAGLDAGERVTVGALQDDDARTLASVFPEAATLLARDDLASLNRNTFMLQQMLASEAPPSTLTEAGLADAWATRGAGAVPAVYGRDATVAQIAAVRVERPTDVPGLARLDPDGVAALVEEGSLSRLPLADGVAFTHDVLEDWALARELRREWRRLPELLLAAGQPLWWQRAVRLSGQMLLEAGRDDEWVELLALLHRDDLDPAWNRQALVAPLYSEAAPAILPRIEPALLADDAGLLGRLLETLRVSETRIDEGVLDSPLLADTSESERFRLAAHCRKASVTLCVSG